MIVQNKNAHDNGTQYNITLHFETQYCGNMYRTNVMECCKQAIMLSVPVLNVVILSVVMVSVAAPLLEDNGI